ncbi:caffeoyl-CoA O-methyltransferase [Allocatelliglobosispora scoriae]|uniref:Caffeoyl-CoA O-methyltransferase n=1 Tax=Allocatelliglobosispora scoriae TaxID=643052 RepID=A0A841BP77_9ACTN|nr:class I SAM-dependent methyltransferase [Allocatelliglobosispora scoriae]MBB5870074.1 caffeoyl-CoA O-methyltransferase [Allocatelliglobosispora scoriae]
MSSPGLTEVKYVPVDAAVRDYLVRSSTPADPVISMLAERTAAVGDAAGMMVPVEQATLLTILVRLLGATTAIDVGTFTGVSALALAQGMAPGGRVITCDVTDRWHPLAREHWELAGMADRIDFRLGGAARTLRELADHTIADLVFIDADKMNYPVYCSLAMELLRPGGLLIVDNVLQDGFVLDPELAEAGLPRRCAETVRDVNASIAADDRLEAVMLPIADGLTIARKK